MRNLFVFVSLAVAATSFGQVIPIVNHSFEADTLGNGSFYYSPQQIPGWTSTATGAPDRGAWNTSSAGKDGSNIAFAYANNSLAQALDASVQSNTVYTIQYLLGRSGSRTRATVELYAGGTVANGVVTGGTLLFSQMDVINQAEMTEFSGVYVSPAVGDLIGQTLSLRVAGTTAGGESYVSFDNFRLSAAPVPEPASALALGLGAFALLRRRR